MEDRHVPADGAFPNHAIVVLYSGKGGVGLTTIALNLACALAEEQRRKVAVVDLDLQYGDVAQIVEAPAPGGSIADLVTAYPGDIDLELVTSALVRGPAGVSLLAAPDRPEMGELVEAHREGVQRVLELLQREFDVVIVDAGGHLGDAGATALDAADAILMVTTATALSMKNMRQAFLLFERLGIEAERLKVVLNRVEPHADFGREEVASNLGRAVFAELPHDSRAAVTALNSGVPVVLGQPRSRLAGALRDLARDLVEGEAGGSREPGWRRLIPAERG